jgi:hypothetical protein
MVRLNPFRKSKGDVSIITSVSKHIETHLGEIAWVMHEKESPLVHVDVYVVRPTKEREHQYLVTSGMSEKSMPVPAGASDGRYAELILGLPPDWPLSQDAFKDEANWWPIRLLKGLARYPHENKTWLYTGHSIPWSTPPKPYADNTKDDVGGAFTAKIDSRRRPHYSREQEEAHPVMGCISSLSRRGGLES